MFKKDEKKIKDNSAIKKVDQDLIVHNMPSRSRLGSASPSKTEERNEFLSPRPNQSSNVKAVGGLIIGVGIIFVLVLIYLSYRFVIKPQASSQPIITPAPITSTNQNNEIGTEEVAQIATTTTVETIEPGSIALNEEDLNENEADNDEENFVLPEEGSIFDDYIWAPILDTDGDGLTDEEELSLGTNPNEIDTDQDGYLDLEEIQAGYDPTGTGKLEESKFIARYQNNNLNYSFLYPNAWTLRDNNTDYLTIITAPDNSLMQISVAENVLGQSILDWYQTTVSQGNISSDRIKTSDLWEGIVGEENLHFYVTGNNRQYIYILSYIPVVSQRLAYPNIFQMMTNSFNLK